MFERFTDSARRIVVTAQQEARELADHRIGTEHLLLGVLANPDCRAHALLAERGVTTAVVHDELNRRSPTPDDQERSLGVLGIDLGEVRRRVEAAFQPGALESMRAAARGHRRPRGHLPFDPTAKKALELALRESRRRRDRHIGSEHVLLGLLHPATGHGQEILAARGVTLADLRAALDEPDAASG